MKNSASYFLGDKDNDSLQRCAPSPKLATITRHQANKQHGRIYGVSFPDKKLMAEHKKFLEEAAKRDHRKIGKDQELFL